MAEVTISGLTAATTVNGTELLEVEQGGTSKRVTASQIAALGGGGGGGGTSDVAEFTDLTDVPSSYSGAALKVVQVNAGATGLEFVPLGGGGDALTSNPLSQFAATTSAQLRGVLSDETGTGAAYFAGGNAGTPSAIGLANGTGLPVAGITGSTATALGVGSVELGHATDTTITRVAAGIAAVEGVNILTATAIDNTAYDATTWDGDSTHAPSKNAVRDKIEALTLSGNDVNGNYSADNFLHGVQTVVSAGVTVTLTVASPYEIRVTGTSTATIKLPVVSTLALGTTFLIRNFSTGTVTVQSSGTNTITTLAADSAATFTSNATTGTTAAVWDVISNSGVLTSSSIDDTAYDATTWNGDTTHAPSKNAVRDKIEALLLSGGGDALTSNPLSQFAATTSLQFKGVISDETGSGAVVFANTPTLVTPDIGVPSAGTLTNCTGLPVSSLASLGTGVSPALQVNIGTAGAVGTVFAKGTATLGTSAIASGATASVVTVASPFVVSTDVILWTPNADISAVTGYAPVTTGGLIIYAYPGTDSVNFKVGNPTASSITPGAVTLNWRVVR